VTTESTVAALIKKVEEQTATINSLHNIIKEITQTNEKLNDTITVLNRTIKELTEKSGKNSGNSSKPPSSDGFNKPSPKSLRKASGKERGGQTGHSGTTLKATAEPDEIILHMPEACKGCSNSNQCKSRSCVNETRQVIDAVVEVKVISHQTLLIENCPLYGGRRKARFPDDVKAPVQYGENLQALTVALNTIGAVSVNRTHEILSSVFSIPLSTGTISNMVAGCANKLSKVTEWICKKVTGSKVTHFDETGTRVDGKTLWVHNASTADYTHLTINAKRGKEGMDAGGVLPAFAGIAIHDCWAPYWKYPGVVHGLCCAHLLRELTGVEENHALCWATDFKNLLLKMKSAKDRAIKSGETRLSDNKLQRFERLYDKIIRQAYAETPPSETAGKKRGRQKKGKVLSLIERLDSHKASICLFIHDFDVPFDNNQAERDIRMVKTKTKVSGCFRSIAGAECYLKIMSFVSSAKKHGFNPYDAIRSAVAGSPFLFLSPVS
jgi:transposase